jgi:hypothetical protein
VGTGATVLAVWDLTGGKQGPSPKSDGPGRDSGGQRLVTGAKAQVRYAAARQSEQVVLPVAIVWTMQMPTLWEHTARR